jgi:hypothetical protein
MKRVKVLESRKIKIQNGFKIKEWGSGGRISWDQNSTFSRGQICSIIFDLMILLVTNKSIIRSKFPINAFLNFDLMKNAAIRRSKNY